MNTIPHARGALHSVCQQVPEEERKKAILVAGGTDGIGLAFVTKLARQHVVEYEVVVMLVYTSAHTTLPFSLSGFQQGD